MTRSFVLGTALLFALSGRASADPAADAHALGERFGAAVAAGDVKAILSLYADDARAMWPGRGDEAHGKAELEAMVKRELPSMRATPLVQKSSDVIAIDATHIMNVGRWEMTMPPSGGGKARETVTVRTSELLVNEGGTWRYLVDHASIGAPPPTPRSHRRAERRR